MLLLSPLSLSFHFTFSLQFLSTSFCSPLCKPETHTISGLQNQIWGLYQIKTKIYTEKTKNQRDTNLIFVILGKDKEMEAATEAPAERTVEATVLVLVETVLRHDDMIQSEFGNKPLFFAFTFFIFTTTI